MIKHIILLLFILLVSTVSADSVDDAIARVEQQIAEAKEQLTQQRQAVAKKRSELQQLISEQDKKALELSQNYKSQEKALTELEDQFYEKDAYKARTNAEIKRCRQLLTEARKDLQSPVQKRMPTVNAFADLDARLSAEGTPVDSIVSGLGAILRSHFSHHTVLSEQKAPVLKPDGTRATATILSLNGICSYIVEGERVGILEPNSADECYSLHPALLPGKMAKSVKESLSTNSGIIHLPVDVTGGRGLSRLESKKDLIGFLKAGGPVVIPLLIIAVLACVMVIERFFYLLRVDKNVDKMLSRVLPYLENGDYDGALSTVDNSHGPVSNIIQSAVSHGRQKVDKLEELLQEAILSELPSLERFLGALAVMAAAAPLLGLLGTVSGMIGTFEIISTYGTGNAKLLSGGISEALITTEVGLIVAVPILLAHAWLNRQVRTLVGHMDRAAISLASAIRQQKEGE